MIKTAKNKKANKGISIAVGAGIFVVMLLFIGLGSFQISDMIKDNCKINQDTYICCNDPGYAEYYSWRESCGSSETQVEKSFCKDSYFPDKTCNDKFSTSMSIIAGICGVILLIVGFTFTKNSAFNFGIILSGIGSIIMALVVYWENLNGWIRVALMGIIAIILIYVSLKKLGN